MPCLLFLALFFSFNVLSSTEDVATKGDIALLIHQMDKRFEQVDKRLEQVDKRFELMEKNMERRFQQVDKRLEMMERNMEKRFEQVDKRFEQAGKRFESMDSKIDRGFDDLKQLVFLSITMSLGLVGFILWDRRTMMDKAKQDILHQVEFKLVAKADKKVLDQVVGIIESLAQQDEAVRDILAQHNLRLA